MTEEKGEYPAGPGRFLHIPALPIDGYCPTCKAGAGFPCLDEPPKHGIAYHGSRRLLMLTPPCQVCHAPRGQQCIGGRPCPSRLPRDLTRTVLADEIVSGPSSISVRTAGDR